MLFLTTNLTNQKELCFFSNNENPVQVENAQGLRKNTVEYKRGTGNWKKHLASQKRGTTSSRRGKGKDVTAPAHREGKRSMPKTLGVSAT